ncbi:ABC transporter permease [Microbulbifer echini]|uniref:ABC transporter permease n=1 Tax=Microbulbifer echini TaxID=1529067 RepID=A0ABV4NNB6_9GAMM
MCWNPHYALLIDTKKVLFRGALIFLSSTMTGQLLASSSSRITMKYQILIVSTIVVGTGFKILVTVALRTRRLFIDHRGAVCG